jgi:hypothetical protein
MFWNILQNRFPLAPQVDLALWLTLALNFKPLVEASVDSQSCHFNNALSDMLASNDIVVAGLNFNIVALVLDIKVPKLVFPHRCFALILGNRRFPLLLAALHNDIGVHLCYHFDIMLELGFNQVNA